MTSSSITSWQICGEKVETVADFIFLGVCVLVTQSMESQIPWTAAHQASLSMEFSRQE